MEASSANGETTFTLTFPVDRELNSTDSDKNENIDDADSQLQVILVVDDNKGVRNDKAYTGR